MEVRFALAATLAMIGSGAHAQEVYYTPARQTVPHVPQRYFPVGTPIELTTRTELSTKDVKPGDRVYLSVAESLTYQGQIIVPVGTQAVGEVAWSEKNGHFGVKGKLGIRLLYVDTPFGQTRIEGEASKNGASGTLASFATIALVSPLGFLIHGTSGKMPYGTTVHAYLAEPLTFVELPAPVQSASLPALAGGQEVAAQSVMAPPAMAEPVTRQPSATQPASPGFRW